MQFRWLAATAVVALTFSSVTTSAATIETGTLNEVINQWSASLTARYSDLGENALGEGNLYLEAPTVTPPPDVQQVVNPLGTDIAFDLGYNAGTGIASMSFNGVVNSFDYTVTQINRARSTTCCSSCVFRTARPA